MNASRSAIVIILCLLFATPSFAIWGTLDKVPGSTIILPFFEVGIDEVVNPHDTRPAIYNQGAGGSVIVHWELYDIDGNARIWGDQTIGNANTWSFSIRSLINDQASVSDLAALTQGDFYNGFMTIDAVTETTDASPFFSGYPFRNNNVLLGYAYYTRLAQGSANGLALPSLEYTANSGVPNRLDGFYGSEDVLEEMDINARICARDLIQEGDCFVNADDTATIRSRVFQSNAINGKTRVIVFAWDTSRHDEGGPSAICDDLGTCATEYLSNRVRENGTQADSRMIRLDHVVNIIDLQTGAVAPGEHILFDVEDPGSSLQLFAFALNSAQPAGNPNTNWDAIFESSILP